MGRILIVDDEARLGRLLTETLEGLGHDVAWVKGGREALARITGGGLDVVITDLRMPGVDGLAVLRETRRASPATDVLIMTAYASAEGAVEAMKEGAADYLVKPFAIDELRLRVARLLERRGLTQRAAALARRLDEREGFAAIVAESPRLRAMLDEARRVATTDETVLLLGESGTGKTLVARAIHLASTRAAGPLVEVHAAALPETLLESELFGHEKGAFTGATDARAGHLEAAGGGTLFLDEIGDISAATQVKLLRFLQDRTFNRLGGTQVRRSDARIIAATNRDLTSAVRAREFREDLYYRLSVFPIMVPPLRERPEDVRALALVGLARRGVSADRISKSALDALAQHAWPGNVRELENALARAVILAGQGIIGPEHLPAPVRGESASALDDLLIDGFQLDEHVRGLIQHAITRAGGNKAAAARALGITRRRLYSLLAAAAGGDGDAGDPE